jgi:hypothetical protein
MQNLPNEQELKDRLSLIETMISEGRRQTESWGWSFVLWGVAYYIAIAWATLGNAWIAWPVTMIATGVATAFLGRQVSSRNPETTVGRGISSIWIAMGLTLFVLCFSLSFSGHAERHAFLAIIEGMLGMANMSSSMILRWRAQFLCGAMWLAAAAASCFVTAGQGDIVFLTAIFLGQIVFGVYMMVLEARERKDHARKSGAVHA